MLHRGDVRADLIAGEQRGDFREFQLGERNEIGCFRKIPQQLQEKRFGLRVFRLPGIKVCEAECRLRPRSQGAAPGADELFINPLCALQVARRRLEMHRSLQFQRIGFLPGG